MKRLIALLFVLAIGAQQNVAGQAQSEEGVWPGFDGSPRFGEQVKEMRIEMSEPGVRLKIIAPAVDRIDPDKPSRVVFFATPNGNTVEQTLGRRINEGEDWHYDIQHIAGQHRKLQEENRRENIVLVCLEAQGLSWPSWRKKHEDNAALIRRVVSEVLAVIPLDNPSVTLASHSGGGSFMFGFINGSDTIPDWIDRIIFLDSNYGYDDEDGHGDKLIGWLNDGAARRLIVIAYDDREITYKGKKVVGPTGGTYRATHRMIERFETEGEIFEGKIIEAVAVGFKSYDAINGGARLMIHRNPENIILHTRMVGEMNGYLQAMAMDTPDENFWGPFGGARVYMRWVEPPPSVEGGVPDPVEADSDEAGAGLTIPPRQADAIGGRDFMKRVEDLSPSDREAAIRDELLSGNVPGFLRRFVSIHTRTKISDDSELSVTYEVAPDYLSIGSDEDFVRVPMTPMTAQAVADAFGCTLPTRKMVDDIYNQAPAKRSPAPLTEDRTKVKIFLQHNGTVEWQRKQAGMPLGTLYAGIKKDVVVTNRLQEKSDRVAIYGWHYLNGRPIQPLYTGHVNTYVDYSHGVRLVQRNMRVAGDNTTVKAVLADPDRAALLSDEGVIREPRY